MKNQKILKNLRINIMNKFRIIHIIIKKNAFEDPIFLNLKNKIIIQKKASVTIFYNFNKKKNLKIAVF